MVANEKHLASAHTINARSVRRPRRRTATFHANAQNSSGSGKHKLPFIFIDKIKYIKFIHNNKKNAHTCAHNKIVSIKGPSQCHWNTFNANRSTSQFASFTGHVPLIERLTPLYRFETIFTVNEILTSFWVRIESPDSFRTYRIVGFR